VDQDYSSLLPSLLMIVRACEKHLIKGAADVLKRYKNDKDVALQCTEDRLCHFCNVQYRILRACKKHMRRALAQAGLGRGKEMESNTKVMQVARCNCDYCPPEFY